MHEVHLLDSSKSRGNYLEQLGDRKNLNGMPEPLAPPIHSVPFELFADILVLALILPRATDKFGSRTSGSLADVLVLCRICSHWRQVGLNTPQLWAQQTFPINLHYKKPEIIFLTVTETFLERSALLPISIHFHIMMKPSEITLLLPALIGAAHRWENLEMHSYKRAEFDPGFLTGIPAGTLANLEKLTLERPRLDAGLDAFQLAPRLPDVILDLHSGPSSHIPLVSWGQLTHLSLDHNSPQVCLDILVRCTNLVSVHFGTNQWRKEDPPIVEKCVLKHMEELHVCMAVCATAEHLDPFL
ncbi:hypothetical protein DFH08DRAFT_370126 [Mycena albidolilacea]|uniref:F-box domain-containing protein n=1 Tax=Mycena albidolilacea TaxID=1033008 RepID=A0AAD7AKG6_9AGAR|nr:hypothetical protein DFH08DRAFT_370126 [Mycena albidolilacea]